MNVLYTIESFDEEIFNEAERRESWIDDDDPMPEKGENLRFEYDVRQPNSCRQEFFDDWIIFVGRKEKNFVRYYEDFEEFEKAVSSFKAHLNKDWAYKRIYELNSEIARLEKDYELC